MCKKTLRNRNTLLRLKPHTVLRFRLCRGVLPPRVEHADGIETVCLVLLPHPPTVSGGSEGCATSFDTCVRMLLHAHSEIGGSVGGKNQSKGLVSGKSASGRVPKPPASGWRLIVRFDFGKFSFVLSLLKRKYISFMPLRSLFPKAKSVPLAGRDLDVSGRFSLGTLQLSHLWSILWKTF